MKTVHNPKPKQIEGKMLEISVIKSDKWVIINGYDKKTDTMYVLSMEEA